MKIIKKENQKQIETETCGLLTEVVNQEKVPVSIVLANDLKPTKPHYHKETVEIYWVSEGQITVKVSGKNKEQDIELNSGDLLVIDTKERHQVIKTSPINKVIVINTPPWQKEDEHIE